MNEENSINNVEKVLTKGSEFKVKTKNEFNKSIDHIIQLISDAYTLYDKGSFSTSVFLSITIIEEVGKIQLGLYITSSSTSKRDLLRNHIIKHKIGSNYTIFMSERLQKAIGKDKIEELSELAYSGKMMELRGNALYCDCENEKFFIPRDKITEEFSKEILLFAIESFDDNLVGYTNYSLELSEWTDKIFTELSKK